VLCLMHSGFTSGPGPVLAYDFESQGGYTVEDRSGNARDASVVGDWPII